MVEQVKLMDCKHFINGQYQSSREGKSFENINPATEEILGVVEEGGEYGRGV